MSYTIEVKRVSKSGYLTPAEARNYYGNYSRDGIAVHWWNEPSRAGTHDQTVSYLTRQAAIGNVSANYVVSNNKITLLVNPDDIAFASGNGNASTISIEFDPRLNAEGYKRGGWLIKELEARYKKILHIWPHSRWVATSCPGTISLARLRQQADVWKSGTNSPKPSGGKKMWQDYPNKDALIKEFYEIIRGSAPLLVEVQSHYRGSPVSTVQGFRKEMDGTRHAHITALANATKARDELKRQLEAARQNILDSKELQAQLAMAKIDIDKLEAQNSDLAARLHQPTPESGHSPLVTFFHTITNIFKRNK